MKKLAIFLLVLLPLIMTVASHADDATTHLQNASKAAQLKDWDTALAEVDAALVLERDNVAAHSGRGQILANSPKHDFKGAIAEFDRVIELAPKFGPAYQMRAAMHAQLGDLDKAHADMVAFLRLTPTEVEKLEKAAQQSTTAGDWQRALNMWTLLVEIAPDNPRGHLGRAIVLPQMYPYDFFGDQEASTKGAQAKEESAAEFAAALKADPTFAPAYIALAQNTLGMRSEAEIKSALAVLDRGITAAPTNVELLVARGDMTANQFAMFAEANLAEAMKFYNRALELDPKNVAALSGRAAIYHRKNQDDLALADTEQAILINPDHYITRKTRAEIFSAQHDYDRAAIEYDRTYALQPGDFSMAFERYLNLTHLKDTTRAVEAIGKIIDANPKGGSYRRYRAELYLSRGEYALALADIDKALELEPDAKKSQELRGKIIAAQNAK